jgi:tetratricopeptide (TPR) repeat protein
MADMEPQVAERLRQVRSAVIGRPESAEAWGRLGMVCHAHELWDCADIAYREAEALDPLEERWHYYLGDVLSVVGTDLDSAERAFRRTLELHPDYAPAHLRLGRVLVAKNEPQPAAEQFERALSLAPDLQPARLSLAQIRLAEKDLETAAELLETLLTSSPRHEQALSTMGRVYMLQGKRDEARRIATRARDAAVFNLYSDPLMGQVEAEGASSVLIWNRARAFFDNGNFEQAARGLSQVVTLLPDNPDVHHELAVALKNLGHVDEAARHLQRVVELDPQRVDPTVLLASIYLDHQRPQDALPLLRKALELAPEDPDAPWLLGRAQVQIGRPEAALESFEKARAASPGRAVPVWADTEWGNALAQSGRLYGALEHFETALSKEPENAQTLFFLGLVHEGLGRSEQAVDFYCRSMKAQPNPPAGGRLQALGRSCG